MGFRYDFGMYFPESGDTEEKSEPVRVMTPEGSLVLFSDPALVEALTGSDQRVRDLFTNAGFGLIAHDNGVPAGRYPAQDEAARNACMRKLKDNIAESGNLKGANWNGVDPLEFLESYISAKPIDEDEIHAIVTAEKVRQKKKTLARICVMACGMAVMVSTMGLVIGAMGG